MPCGRCRQLLYEHGGHELVLMTPEGERTMDAGAAPGLRTRRPEARDGEPGRGPMSQHDAVEVIIAKRDQGELTDSQIDWVVDAYTRGEVADEQMSVARDGDPAQRHEPPRDRPLDRRDDRVGGADGLLRAVATDRRQALDRRGRRQDHPAARTARRGLRGRRTPAVGPRPRPHRRHPRQARVDPGLAGAAVQRGDAGAARVGRRGHLRGRRRAGARRQEAVRPARRHRHRRGDPADRVVDHVQEDRRGHRRAGARRQGRLGRLHEVARHRSRAGRDHGGARHRRRGAHGRAADRHGDPAGPDRRQRDRGRRVGRGARRRRTGRRGRADPGPGPRDARRAPA